MSHTTAQIDMDKKWSISVFDH